MDRTFASVRDEYKRWEIFATIADKLSVGAPQPVTPEQAADAYRQATEATMRDALPWGAPSTQEWHASIARDAARTWATAAWVGREAV